MSEIFLRNSSEEPKFGHRGVLDALRDRGCGVYLGHDRRGWCFTAAEHSVMVLGPPRSGKTTSIIIPNVLAADGAVVSTSTKPDVLDATVSARSEVGELLRLRPDRLGGRQVRPTRDPLVTGAEL